MATNPFPTPFVGPTVQLAYANTPSQPAPGSLADDGIMDVQTAINLTTLGVFGTLVTNDPSVVQGWKYATGALTDGVLGILVRTSAIESRRDNAPPSYDKGVPANVVKFGRVWTTPEVAVNKHDAVYVRTVANGALNQLGSLRNDNDGGNAQLVSGAKWMDTCIETGQSRIELNQIGA
jgi:hypothetical protein